MFSTFNQEYHKLSLSFNKWNHGTWLCIVLMQYNYFMYVSCDIYFLLNCDTVCDWLSVTCNVCCSCILVVHKRKWRSLEYEIFNKINIVVLIFSAQNCYFKHFTFFLYNNRCARSWEKFVEAQKRTIKLRRNRSGETIKTRPGVELRVFVSLQSQHDKRCETTIISSRTRKREKSCTNATRRACYYRLQFKSLTSSLRDCCCFFARTQPRLGLWGLHAAVVMQGLDHN